VAHLEVGDAAFSDEPSNVADADVESLREFIDVEERALGGAGSRHQATSLLVW